jgi:hypothetical protein
MRKSLPVMNPPSGPMSSAPTVATSSGVPGRPCRRHRDHAPVSFAARPVEFIPGEKGHEMPGLIVFTRAPRLPQRTASAATRSEFPRFEIWYA